MEDDFKKSKPIVSSHTFPVIEREIRLTKREYFAVMALQGIWANPHPLAHSEKSDLLDRAADVAVRQADALIAALNGEVKK
jgi:hypothetical protein